MRAFADYFIGEDDEISYGSDGGCVKIRSDEGTINIWFSGQRKELIAKAIVAAANMARGENDEPNA